MKQYISKNKILLIILAIGIIASIAAVWGRMSVESQNKSYDIVIDYAEMAKLAAQSDHDIAWWLEQYRDMGITRVALTEESFDTMKDDDQWPVEADVAFMIMEQADWRSQYPAEFVAGIESRDLDRYDVIAKACSAESFEFISRKLGERFDDSKFWTYPSADGNGGYIWMDGTVKQSLHSETTKEYSTDGKGFTEKTTRFSSKLMYQSLGMDEKKVSMIESLGMEIVPRTFSYEDWNDTDYANAVVEDYNKLAEDPSYLIIGGSGVIGYDDGTEVIENYMEKSGASIALIEMTDQLKNIEQDGVEEVVKDTDYNTVRVFSVWPYIQYRYGYYGYEGAEEVENTLFRAITERNVRVIYWKPMKETDDSETYIVDVDIYRDMFANLEDRLARHGFSMGRATVMSSYTTPSWLKMLMGFGAVAAAILVLGGIIPLSRKTDYILMILGAIGVVGAFIVMPNTAKLLLSFGSAVVMACLVCLLTVIQAKNDMDRIPANAGLGKIIPRAGLTLIIAVVVALAGGIMTAAPISEINFMLELEVYRGVKVAQLLPLAFFVLAFLAYFGFTENKKKQGCLEIHDLKELFCLDLKLWMVILGCALAGVGVYYIMRTGHTSNTVPSTPEMLMRNTLEEWLMARPRSKEFLFAFPAIMMFVYTAARKWKLWAALFGLCSVIGMTSVINTFMHIRTPLYLGLYRTAFSLLFGLILGVIAIIIFELLWKLWKKIAAYFKNHSVEA